MDAPAVSPTHVDVAMSYTSYRKMIDRLLEEDKTTGENHSEAMLEYTRMNVQRMKRLDKRTELIPGLEEALEETAAPMTWLVLTEAWCGDAAQNIPPINRMADQATNIELKLLLRDDHTDLMDRYLTDGGRAIPKLICLHAENLQELGTWGPRPAPLQEKAVAWKKSDGISSEERARRIHTWYAKDRTQTLQQEFQKLLQNEWQS
ncbi:MAG: thioredoxin family protein [Balneolaceae bacterium]|nr:thioredoxin family protein [Balneolaceae bacterium]